MTVDLFNLDQFDSPVASVGGPSRTKMLAAMPRWLRNLIGEAYKVKGVDWGRSSEDESEDYHALSTGSLGIRTTLGSAGVDAEAMYSGPPVGGDAAWSHVVMLDIDHEAILLPSSTEGHYHLIVQHYVEWDDDYVAFLQAAAKIGLIQQGYVAISMKRKATCLRLPWIRKGREEADAKASMEEWLNEPEQPSAPSPPL